MILSETEEILVIIAGAAFIMAILGNALKDYRRMRWEAKKQIRKKEAEEAYVKKLKKIIDDKNSLLQAELEKRKKE